MKKGKRLLALLLALGVMLMLSGCGGFETKLTRAAAQMKKLGSFHMDMDVDLTMSLSVLGESLDMGVGVNLANDMFTDPLKAKMDMTLNAPGSDGHMLYYMQKEGEDTVLYLSADGGATWEKRSVELGELPVQLNVNSAVRQVGLFLSAAKSFHEAGTESLDGQTTTRYDGTLEGSLVVEAMELTGILNTLSDQLGTELDESLFENRQLPTSLWFENKSGRLVRYEMDFTDVMADVVDQMLKTMLEAYGLGAIEGLPMSVELSAPSS